MILVFRQGAFVGKIERVYASNRGGQFPGGDRPHDAVGMIPEQHLGV